MNRPVLVVALLLSALAVGSAVGVAAAAAPNDERVSNESTDEFGIEFEDNEVSGAETTNLTVSGVAAGQQVEITTDIYPPAVLPRMMDGTPTAEGVRVRVPADGTIPVDFGPVDCRSGAVTFTAQRRDTGETATTRIADTVEQDADASFTGRNHTVEAGDVLRLPIRTACHGVGVHIWDTESAFDATVTVEDDQRISTIYLDTGHLGNASRAFRAGLPTNLTSASVTAPPDEVAGDYRMRLTGVDLSAAGQSDTEYTPPRSLSVTPSGNDSTQNRTSASAFDIELEGDLYVGPGREADRTPLRLSGVDPGTRLALTSDAYSPSRVARMVDGTVRNRTVRVTVPENRTLLVDSEPVTCRTTDFTLTAQRLDTGMRASTAGAAVQEMDFRTALSRESYSVHSEDVLPVTVETNCHRVGVSVWDDDFPLSMTALAANDDPTVTFWFDTSASTGGNTFLRSSLGDTLTSSSMSIPPAGEWTLSVGDPTRRDGRLLVSPVDSARLEIVDDSPRQPTADATPTTETTDRAASEPSTRSPTRDAPSRTATPTARTQPTNPTTAPPSTETTTGDGPGFGLAVTLAALLVVVLLATRRR